MMDALVAMVPLARTPAWTITVLEASRNAIMLDPAWKDGTTSCRGWRSRREPREGVRRERVDLSNVCVRAARCWHESRTKRRLRQGAAREGPAESGVGA